MNAKKNEGYVIWGIASMIYIIIFFHRVALGAVKMPVLVQIGIAGTPYEGSLYAMLAGMYMYAYMLMQIPTGILADTVGPRKTITAGAILTSFGTLGFIFSTSIYTAAFFRLCVGAGSAVVFVCILKLITAWFPKEQFTVMSGLTSFIGNMGAVLAISPLVYASEKMGWHYALGLIAVLGFVLAGLSAMLLKDRPDMEAHDVIKQSIDVKHCVLKILRDGKLYPVMIAYGLTFGGTMALTGTWGIELVENLYGVSRTSAAQSMTMMTIGVAIGCVLIGKVAKQAKTYRGPMVAFSGAHFICWLVLLSWRFQGVALQMLFFLLGVTGTSFIVSWNYAKSKYKLAYSGIVMSVVNFFGFLGGALVPQIVGGVYDVVVQQGSSHIWMCLVVYLTVNAGIAFILLTTVENT